MLPGAAGPSPCNVREVGSGAAKREAREKLLEAARRREIDVVLVWRLDRWGRSVTDLLATLQELEHLGVGFVSLTEALDLTTPAGRAMAGLLAVFAAFEREILGERTRAGLAHARQNGKRLGRPATAAVHAAEIRKLHRAGVSQIRDRPPAADRAHFRPPNPGRFLPEIGRLAFFTQAHRKHTAVGKEAWQPNPPGSNLLDASGTSRVGASEDTVIEEFAGRRIDSDGGHASSVRCPKKGAGKQ